MKKIIIGVFVLIVVLVVALVFIASRTAKEKTGETAKQQETTSQNQTQQEISPQVPLSDVPIPENLPPGVNIEKLQPVGGKTGEVIFIAVNDEGKLSVAIEGDLGAPKSGSSYWAWLTTNAGQVKKLGKLEFKNNRYMFSDTLEGDYSIYEKTVISEEINDDNNIESTIFEGNID